MAEDERKPDTEVAMKPELRRQLGIAEDARVAVRSEGGKIRMRILPPEAKLPDPE